MWLPWRLSALRARPCAAAAGNSEQSREDRPNQAYRQHNQDGRVPARVESVREVSRMRTIRRASIERSEIIPTTAGATGGKARPANSRRWPAYRVRSRRTARHSRRRPLRPPPRAGASETRTRWTQTPPPADRLSRFQNPSRRTRCAWLMHKDIDQVLDHIIQQQDRRPAKAVKARAEQERAAPDRQRLDVHPPGDVPAKPRRPGSAGTCTLATVASGSGQPATCRPRIVAPRPKPQTRPPPRWQYVGETCKAGPRRLDSNGISSATVARFPRSPPLLVPSAARSRGRSLRSS